MSLLGDIAPSVQQVAEAIAIAVGVEVEIVDNELTIIGGTAIYQDRIGQKKAVVLTETIFMPEYAYRKTEYIEDAANYEYYDSVVPEVASENWRNLYTDQAG